MSGNCFADEDKLLNKRTLQRGSVCLRLLSLMFVRVFCVFCARARTLSSSDMQATHSRAAYGAGEPRYGTNDGTVPGMMQNQLWVDVSEKPIPPGPPRGNQAGSKTSRGSKH